MRASRSATTRQGNQINRLQRAPACDRGVDAGYDGAVPVPRRTGRPPMRGVLVHPVYGRLLAAQIVALLGTGLATVALGLLAYDLADNRAGAVLGTVLAIKMVAYIAVAPVVGAFAARYPRRGFLIVMDVIRGLAVLSLPFVTAVWQVYVLVVVLQSASAAFTPTFQATIPDVLPDERDYTQALALSRLAYDIEALVSPLVAAALLTVVAFDGLFAGTALGFAASAALVASVTLPRPPACDAVDRGRGTRGVRISLATPRLRGLLALNLAVAAGGAMVIVNTTLYVQGELGRTAGDVAVALGAYGAGSMLVALVTPRLLDRVGERTVMLTGAAILAAALAAGVALDGTSFVALLGLWAVLGAGGSFVLVPSGRLLRRSARPADRPALFAAQFALSHVCWLLAYVLAGYLVPAAGFSATFAVLALLAVAGLVTASRSWPAAEDDVVLHVHTDLPDGHPHVAGARRVTGGWQHEHTLVIDTEHRRWPTASAPRVA